MFKRLIVLAVVSAALSFSSASAAPTPIAPPIVVTPQASNTGWPCPIPHQWVNAGNGAAYWCRPSTMTWWLTIAPW